MSATLNAGLFSSYFGGSPVVDVSGRTYPVEAFFLEDVVQATAYTLEEDSEYASRHSTQRSMFVCVFVYVFMCVYVFALMCSRKCCAGGRLQAQGWIYVQAQHIFE